MRANRYRGEITATIANKSHRLCLTLGGLAELETAFGVDNLQDLSRRLASGRLSADQLAAILAAGLRGGGHDMDEATVAKLDFEGGVSGMMRLAADLVSAAFGVPAGTATDQAREHVGENPCPPQDR